MVDLVISRTLHLVFAAIWAGSVFYVAFSVLPLARDGAFNTTKPLERLTETLVTITRVSAFVLLASGAHLTWVLYSVDGTGRGLFTSTDGQLVILKVLVWLALAGVVEVGAKRFESGLNGKKIREPANDVLSLFRVAAVLAVVALLAAGLINANVGRLF